MGYILRYNTFINWILPTMKATPSVSPTDNPTMRPIGGPSESLFTFCDVVALPEATALITEVATMKLVEIKLVVTVEVSTVKRSSDVMP